MGGAAEGAKRTEVGRNTQPPNPDRINTDGIDPDGCRDVVVSACRMVCGDDCIVIKSAEGDPRANIVADLLR
jgi:polygalacturonase